MVPEATRIYRLAYQKAYRAKNRDRVNANKRAARAKQDPEIKRARGRAYYAANKEKVLTTTRRCNLLVRYGLTPAQRASMEESQGGKCAICGNPPSGKTRIASVLHIDHDHQTGAVRLLLCMDCNVAIGRFKDNPDLCRKAAEYLERFATKEVRFG